jgi:antitoxin MazE
MVKRLTRTGNSLAIVLDRPLLEAANIDEDTPLEVSTNGDVIVITPARGKKRTAKLEAAVAAIDEQFAGAFRRLAK